MDSTINYLIFIALLVVIIVGGVVLRLVMKRSGNQRKFRPAVLIKTEREYGDATTPDGKTVHGVVAMKLTFQFKDGTVKTFPVDNKVRGKCSEQEWGDLMYEGDKLLKFTCKSGTIGTKLYVPAKNSVFHKFTNK